MRLNNLPRQITKVTGKKEEVLELSREKLNTIYDTAVFDFKLSNLLKDAFTAEAKFENDMKFEIPF